MTLPTSATPRVSSVFGRPIDPTTPLPRPLRQEAYLMHRDVLHNPCPPAAAMHARTFFPKIRVITRPFGPKTASLQGWGEVHWLRNCAHRVREC